jgi:predicted dithiol-disulfide oxidoreductase (DUF899 family)
MPDVPGSILKRPHCSAVMKKTILRTKSYRSFIQAEDFLRDGSNVYRTYFTRGRGLEYLGTNFSYLDLTPYGRQENWEDSPESWPQTPPYEWWRHHDRY